MDDSIFASTSGVNNGSASQPSSSRHDYGREQTRFGAGADFNARNLLDESMDLHGETAEEDDDSMIHKGAYLQQHATLSGQDYRTRALASSAARLPEEVERVQLNDRSGAAATTTATAAAAASPLSGTNGGSESASSTSPTEAEFVKPSLAGNDLPREPPLSAEERRKHVLTTERDDLARMNSLLEAAISSIERTTTKMNSFQSTISTTHKIMETYTRILSQAEHTQQLLLDGSWEAQRDEDEMREEVEAEERKQREQEQRLAREEREAAEREARERDEAERKAAVPAKPHGRGRGIPTRGVPGSRSRASATQRGGLVRGTARGRGVSTTQGTSRNP